MQIVNHFPKSVGYTRLKELKFPKQKVLFQAANV